MLRDEYLRRLIDETYVDLYLSGNEGCRIYWPWRMQPPWEATHSYRNACEKYIVDSGPQRPSVGNEDVLDKAFKTNADMALLVDYFPFDKYAETLNPEDNPDEWEAYQDLRREYGDAFTATVDSIERGIELYLSHPFDGEIIIPLQAPYDECYQHFPGFDRYSIGGLNRGTERERIGAAVTVRELAPDVWLHGLGWGARDKLVASVHENPNLIDSVDYSTPMQTAIDSVTAGKERMSVQAARAGARLIEDLRKFTPYIDPPNAGNHCRSTLAEF